MLTVTRNRSRRSSPIGCSAMRWRRAGVHVRRRAHLERDAAVAHVGGQPAELVLAVGADVMSSTMRTPWPSRSAPHHCSASQIDGRPNASPAWMVAWKFSRCDELERVEVAGRRVAGLGAGDVEADHARVAPAHGQLGDLEAAGRGAHGRTAARRS